MNARTYERSNYCDHTLALTLRIIYIDDHLKNNYWFFDPYTFVIYASIIRYICGTQVNFYMQIKKGNNKRLIIMLHSPLDTIEVLFEKRSFI